MAYKNTYEDLMQDIAASGQQWSEADLRLAAEDPDAGRRIYESKAAYASAQTDAQRQAANASAEAVRQGKGYRAGSDGMGYEKLTEAPAYTAYQSRYGEKIDALLEELGSREPFSYSHTDDPAYAAYAEHYRNAGEQAMKDALGRAAAMTGGQPSTYAVSAAQQAQNNYNAALSDVIPQLREAAYAMYLDEGSELRSELSAYLTADEAAYDRHMDAYDRALEKWQTDYAVSQDAAKTGGSGRGGTSAKTEDALAGTVVDRMLAFGDDVMAYEYLLSLGYSEGKTEQLQTLYNRSRVGVNDSEFEKLCAAVSDWMAKPGRSVKSLEGWLSGQGINEYVISRLVRRFA